MKFATAAQAFDEALSFINPPPVMNVWQWGEAYRWMRKGITAKPGPYRIANGPYQQEPQESFDDPTVQVTVLQWAKRTGKTEMINNLHGKTIHLQPRNILVGYPTLDSAKKWSKQFFVPMIRSTRVLRLLVSLRRSREISNTILSKEFPGGNISAVGANSPTAFRQIQAPVVTLDEIDGMDDTAEGDPVELAFGRSENYPDCIQVLSSTPTIKGSSRIEHWMSLSDYRKWFVPCHKCSGSFVLEFEQVKWPKGKPAEAMLQCPLCSEMLTDADREKMIREGEWRATQPFNGIRGYWLNGMNTLFAPKKGFASKLHQIAEDFLRAEEKGRESLMVWWNTFKALTWEDELESVKPEPLLLRRENYGPTLPQDVILLTGQVDTQQNRLVLEVTGWGLGLESWGIEYRQLFGNPHDPRTWNQLNEYLAKAYAHPSGARLRIVIMGIDSGGVDNTDSAFSVPVYRYVLSHQQASRGRGGVIAIKGSSVRGAPLAQERLQKGKGVNLLLVGTDTAKSTIYDWVKIQAPGPRYMHWTDHPEAGFNEEYFKGLTAEKIRSVKRMGFIHREWVKTYERNEPLDVRVYGLALIDLLNPDFHALAAQLKPQEPAPPAIGQPQPRPAMPRKPQFALRRFGK